MILDLPYVIPRRPLKCSGLRREMPWCAPKSPSVDDKRLTASYNQEPIWLVGRYFFSKTL